MGTSLPARDEASQQGIVAFFLAKIKDVLYNSAIWKTDAQSQNITCQLHAINNDAHCNLLEKHLKPSIRSKCHVLCSGPLLQHNTRSYTICATAQQITDLHFQCSPHPAYSPYFTSSGYHILGPLRKALDGKKFSTDEEIKETVHRLDFFPSLMISGTSEVVADLH